MRSVYSDQSDKEYTCEHEILLSFPNSPDKKCLKCGGRVDGPPSCHIISPFTSGTWETPKMSDKKIESEKQETRRIIASLNIDIISKRLIKALQNNDVMAITACTTELKLILSDIDVKPTHLNLPEKL